MSKSEAGAATRKTRARRAEIQETSPTPQQPEGAGAADPATEKGPAMSPLVPLLWLAIPILLALLAQFFVQPTQ